MSINHTTREGKIAFSLIKNCKTSDYPEGNCKLAWDRLIAKYAPKTAPSLLKLKKKFENSKLEDVRTKSFSDLQYKRKGVEKCNFSNVLYRKSRSAMTRERVRTRLDRVKVTWNNRRDSEMVHGWY